MKKGLLLALAHCVLALTITAKFAYDRQTLPRVWARTGPYDPYLPFRGRYVSLNLEVDVERDGYVALSVEGDRLVGRPAEENQGHFTRAANGVHFLTERVAFFIPADAPDPSIRERGEELWVEVSVPRQGLPRPIRLGVKKDGVLTPLQIH